MNVKRIGLILADILVMLMLLFSFILFYLYPVKKEKILKIIPPSVDINKSVILLNPIQEKEVNQTMTLEEFMRYGYTLPKKPVDIYLEQTLQKRLDTLKAKKGQAVYVRLFKQEMLMEVWIYTGKVYEHLKSYAICAYSGELGPKLKEGDRQSPEGFYKVKKQQLNPNSKFHLSFNLGYPNKYDKAHKRTGSFLMIHGNCVSIGCYAMTNAKIEEIYGLVESALKYGQKFVQVSIYPFRMTQENLTRYHYSQWYIFWKNLKEGYDYFEKNKVPPKIYLKYDSDRQKYSYGIVKENG